MRSRFIPVLSFALALVLPFVLLCSCGEVPSDDPGEAAVCSGSHPTEDLPFTEPMLVIQIRTKTVHFFADCSGVAVSDPVELRHRPYSDRDLNELLEMGYSLCRLCGQKNETK